MITKREIIVLAILCLVFCQASFIRPKRIKNENLQTPKLPMYVGSSYHILYGNPKN